MLSPLEGAGLAREALAPGPVRPYAVAERRASGADESRSKFAHTS